MGLAKLYQVRTGGELSPEDCKCINHALAQIKLAEIPKSQIKNVTDYLVLALNMSAVQQKHAAALGTLLRDLQDCA